MAEFAIPDDLRAVLTLLGMLPTERSPGEFRHFSGWPVFSFNPGDETDRYPVGDFLGDLVDAGFDAGEVMGAAAALGLLDD